jgi:hypothetical protein
VQGRFGQALSFNGLSDVVVIPSAASLNLSSGMTLEAWVYPTAVQSSWRAIMHKERDAYYLHASSPGGPMLPAGGAILGGTEFYSAATTAMPISSWTHLAATYDGATLRLFMNGTEVATRAVSGSIQVTGNPLRIGGNSYTDQFFQGLIDEVRVYDHALSASEIQTDMTTAVSARRPPPPSNLRVLTLSP